MSDIKKTPLSDVHTALGARMVPFAGWEMPVQYTEGILAEHEHTRSAASLFDICHMGEFRVKGPRAAEELDRALARAVTTQKPGSCRYNFLLTEQGAVIDDLVAYRLAEDEFYIVVNAGTKDGDAETIQSRLSDSAFADESDATCKLDLQGPKSVEVLESLGFERGQLPTFYKWIQTSIKDIPCLLSRTGYTGELGFEIYAATDKAVELWNMLIACPSVKPAGLGARDTLRLEVGLALYGHELDLETTPIDAGYAPLLKLDDNRTFVGSEALRNNPPKKKLIAIELEGRRAAREGAAIFMNGDEIGNVTSGAFSPSLKKAIAMGYVLDPTVTVGEKVELDAGRKRIPGVVVELPFYKDGTARMKV